VPLSVLIALVAAAAAWSVSVAPRAHPGRLGAAPGATVPAPTLPPTTPSPTVPPSSVPSPTVPPSSVPQSSTTSGAPVGSCRASSLPLQVSTDATAYAVGAPVYITLSVTNDGPPCSGLEASGPCVDGAAVSSRSGAAVWVSNIGPYACPALIVEAIPTGWHDVDHVTWNQEVCPALGSSCTHAPALSGSYSVAGEWGTGPQSSRSLPVTITIGSP